MCDDAAIRPRHNINHLEIHSHRLTLVQRGSYPQRFCRYDWGMPFKFNAARRHRIPRARYRVRNWQAYEAGLRRRGDLTLWIDEAALDRWQAPPQNTPGGRAIYSDLAIEMVLMLRTMFHYALRQAEAFASYAGHRQDGGGARTRRNIIRMNGQ